MQYNDLKIALHDVTARGNTKAIFALSGTVTSENLMNDKELEEAYRMALSLVSD